MQAQDSEIIEKANQLLFDGKVGEAIINYQKIVLSVLEGNCHLVYEVQGLGFIEDQKGLYQSRISSWYKEQIEHKLPLNPFEGLALCFSFRNRVFEGRTWYEEQIKKYPQSYQIVFGLAVCYYNSNLTDQSFKMFKRAISLNAKCDKAYQGLAYLYFYKLDQNQKARQYALQALNYNKSNIFAQLIVTFTETDFNTKIKLFEKLIETQPEHSCKIYHLIGLIHYQQGDTDQAIHYFDLSLSIRQYIAPVVCLATIAFQRGYYQQASQLSQWSLTIQSSNFQGLLLQGCSMIYLQRYHQAGEWLYSALEINQTHPLPNYYIGVLYYQQGEYQQAEEWFDLSQKCEEHLIGTSACEWMMGNYTKATRYLQKYALQIGDRMEVQFELARLYFERNKYEQALKIFMKIEEKVQDDPLTLFMIGSCYINLNKQRQGKQYFHKSIEVDSNFQSGFMALGYLSLEEDCFQKATEYFTSAVNINIQNSEAGQLLAKISHLKVSKSTILNKIWSDICEHFGLC